MASPTSPNSKPLYLDPEAQPRSRRGSTRASFAHPSLSRSASSFEARAPCPKDGDAFCYDPSQLTHWEVPQDIETFLPEKLRSALTTAQLAGAAVLTGFERLDKHTQTLNAAQTVQKVPLEEVSSQLEQLPAPKLRTFSNASSVFHSDYSSPITAGSPQSQSGCASPMISTINSSQTGLSSPMSLGPPDPNEKAHRSRERSFSTPLEPQDSYFAMELSHLRTEALPRLRHMSHKVDTEFYEAKRTGHFTSDNANIFENWWAEKKVAVIHLDDQGKRLASAHGLLPSGMGWTIA